MASNKVDDYFQKQIAKIQFKLKTEACPVNPGLCKAFKLRILFATDLAAAMNSESCQRKIQSFYELFDVSRRGRRFISAALHKIQFRTF